MSSTSSPPPTLSAATLKDKDKKKKKKTKKAADTIKSFARVPDDADRDEGHEDDLSYKPPDNVVLLDHDVETGEFDWDAIEKDDNLELWVMRVPDSVEDKHLKGIQLTFSPNFEPGRVGTLSKKDSTFDIWSLPDDNAHESAQVPVGGEELLGLSCMLPRRRKGGKLFRATKPITRHLVMSVQQPPLSTSNLPSSQQAFPDLSEPYRRYKHPSHLLKHRFTPIGYVKPPAPDENAMDVDQPLRSSQSAVKDADDKAKKRKKVETQSPKKTKRTKLAT